MGYLYLCRDSDWSCRRAKAKLQDGKKGRGESAETPPDTPPELATGYEVDLHNLIHEDEGKQPRDDTQKILNLSSIIAVTLRPCTDWSVGTWRRIATTIGKHDLVAFVCDAKRCLTWFIHSAGYGFKMEIPFDTILNTQFTNASPGSGLATFILSQPPCFYLENLCTPRPDGSRGRVWKRCADWTEGMQATKVLRHDLIGSAVQLAHLLRNLSTSTHGPDIRLHSPSYHHGVDPCPTTVDVPQPPMASLSGPGYHHREETLDVPRSDYLIHGRKRSYSGPELHHPPEGSGYPTINVTPSADILHASSATYSSYNRHLGRPPSNSANSPMFSDYPESESNQHSPVDYDSTQISTEQNQRTYSTHPIQRGFYDEEARIVSPYQMEPIRRNSSSGSAPATDLDTPSPPILTTPFHPLPEILHGPKPSEIMTGLPTIPYEVDDDIHHGWCTQVLWTSFIKNHPVLLTIVIFCLTNYSFRFHSSSPYILLCIIL